MQRQRNPRSVRRDQRYLQLTRQMMLEDQIDVQIADDLNARRPTDGERGRRRIIGQHAAPARSHRRNPNLADERNRRRECSQLNIQRPSQQFPHINGGCIIDFQGPYAVGILREKPGQRLLGTEATAKRRRTRGDRQVPLVIENSIREVFSK